MKKTFIEPNIRKIELNLSENIASSGTSEYGFICWYHFTECTVQHSGKTFAEGIPPKELTACYASSGTSKMRGGMIVSEEIARMYIR